MLVFVNLRNAIQLIRAVAKQPAPRTTFPLKLFSQQLGINNDNGITLSGDYFIHQRLLIVVNLYHADFLSVVICTFCFFLDCSKAYTVNSLGPVIRTACNVSFTMSHCGKKYTGVGHVNR